jgi:hypothetical protein
MPSAAATDSASARARTFLRKVRCFRSIASTFLSGLERIRAYSPRFATVLARAAQGGRPAIDDEARLQCWSSGAKTVKAQDLRFYGWLDRRREL